MKPLAVNELSLCSTKLLNIFYLNSHLSSGSLEMALLCSNGVMHQSSVIDHVQHSRDFCLINMVRTLLREANRGT